jgi:hypothetical protein
VNIHPDGPTGQVAVDFICTDRGNHGPVQFGFASYAEGDDDVVDDLGPVPLTFVRTRGVMPGDNQQSQRLDDKCPRCGRHPRYNERVLRAIASAVLAANLEPARRKNSRKRLFRRTFDVSFRD